MIGLRSSLKYCLCMFQGEKSQLKVKIDKFKEFGKLSDKIYSIDDETLRESGNLERNYQNGFKSYQKLIERTNLIDWLLVVCDQLSFSDECFFTTVEIFDQILIKYDFKLQINDAHLLAITSLFISMKYTETRKYITQIFVEKVAHNKYSKNLILSSEILILKLLKFKIPRNIFQDWIYPTINSLIKHENCFYKQILFSFACAQYKLSLYDFFLIKNQSKQVLYMSIFYSSLFQLKNYLKNFFQENLLENFIRKANIFEIRIKSILICTQKLLKFNSSGFIKNYKYLNIAFQKLLML